MKSLKKITIIIILACTIQNYYSPNLISAVSKPPNIGVLLFSFNDPYLSLVRQHLENIEKENPTKVKFSFYDARDNQAIQNETIDTLVNNNIDLLLLNLVDTKQDTISDIINKANSKNIPIIFFNIELPIYTKQFYNKALIVATDSKVSGIMQGEILVDLWNKNKVPDKNNDNKLQYIMLQGKTSNQASLNRTIYSISELNNNGIQTQELALTICNWEEDCAKNSISSLFLKYGDQIEAIIANNDAMAIGAVKALQTYGYNKGDNTKTIPVVGIDAIPEAIDLINKGFMAGTVAQNPKNLADALYSIGLNLIYSKYPLEGTDYKFAKENLIEIPYYKYTK